MALDLALLDREWFEMWNYPFDVSGRDGSHWSSPPLSHNSDSLTFNSDGSLLTDASLPHHHIISQNESGFCDDSDITGSSQTRKQLHSPYSTGVGTYSDCSGKIDISELPTVFQPPRFPRSASVEDTAHDPSGPADVLAEIHQQRRRNPRKYPYPSLSQDTYTDYRYHPFSLSQATHHPPLRMHHLRDPAYSYKPGSPASSSDTSSMVSSVVNRLGSQSASEVSFTTTSSSRSNPNRLPRPPHPPSTSTSALSSSSGSNTSILPHRHPASRGRSDKYGYPRYAPSLPPYDSDHEEDSGSTPISMKLSQKDERGSVVGGPKHPLTSSHPPPMGYPQRRERDVQMTEREVMLREREAKSKRRRKPDQPRIPEEGSHRDSFTMKLEMVLSVLSIVSSTKDQTDADAAKILLALSQSSETGSVMRQSACMNMLIQIIHHVERKGDKSHREARLKAAEATRNIIESSGDTRQGKHELCVLGVLEKIRSHCDLLFEFINTRPGTRRVDPTESESFQNACDIILHAVRKLYKYSNEKEHYRPAILSLGGLQTVAEILVVNYRVISAQRGSRASEKPVCHSPKTITVVISILINLTYGDVNNKSMLCVFPDFLKSLMFHLRQPNEPIISSGAQVLRNLSWRATADIKDSLFKCDASVALMGAIDHVKEEPTIQHITSALWNLSAHSVENRHKICCAPFAIQQLVEMLSYNSPSGTTAVVENVGGILKNLSVVIMQDGEYRRKFREAGGLAKLVQHLKSRNKTVLANATGILWNLSARYPEDQKHLWDLGCIPLLDVLQTAHQKNIAECSRGALRNLLAFGQSNGWTSKSDVTAYNIKTQRGFSKSLSYAANYAFSHSSVHSTKHSNESLHSRRSQPLPKNKVNGSNTSLKSSTERVGSADSRSGRWVEERDGHPYRGYKDGNSSNDEDEYMMQKHKNKLKFSRVGSAPGQASINGLKEDEWSSYMPGSYSNKPNAHKAHPDDSRRRKTGRSSRPRGRSIPYSLSQTDSYHLTSNSELHSVSGASFGLSAHLIHEPGEAPSLSALDPKLDSFDPNHGGSARRHEEYADLEVEDDDNDDIDHPIRRDESDLPEVYSCADNFARIQTTMRRGPESTPPSILKKTGPVGRLSPSKGGTSNLALDGTINGRGEDTSDDSSEDEQSPRSLGNKIVTDV